MGKYLYGASISGIQGFIFQTNMLREIVGASEIVASISSDFFKSQFARHQVEFCEENLLMAAAGNIKYVFDQIEDCEKIVRVFPKAVMELADGISIAQAVVKIDGDKDEIQELEKRLRIQRNKQVTIKDTSGLMVTGTARATGGVGFEYSKGKMIDLGQHQKRKASDLANRRLIEDIVEEQSFKSDVFPFDISDMVSEEGSQSWIAVVHADGNSIGNKLREMGQQLKGDEANAAFKEFSKRLDKATKEAVRVAFKSVVEQVYEQENLDKIPFRPVVLGGDDLTAIVRGDLALDFSHRFLVGFEEITYDYFKDFDRDYGLKGVVFSEGLTACAGIAYIKYNYPFHYGVRLAEALCQRAKFRSKKINRDHSPSSLLFHKVHSSFVENYDEIVERELTIGKDIFFDYGPYFLKNQDGYDTINELKIRIKELNKPDAPKARLRNWLSELETSESMAEQTLKRIQSLNSKYVDSLSLGEPFVLREDREGSGQSLGRFLPLYDAMVLSSIEN